MIDIKTAVAKDQQQKNEQARLLEEKKSAAKQAAENELADTVRELEKFATANLPSEVKWEVETSLTEVVGQRTNPGGYEHPGFRWGASLEAQVEGYPKTNLGVKMSEEELVAALLRKSVQPSYGGKVEFKA